MLLRPAQLLPPWSWKTAGLQHLPPGLPSTAPLLWLDHGSLCLGAAPSASPPHPGMVCSICPTPSRKLRAQRGTICLFKKGPSLGTAAADSSCQKHLPVGESPLLGEGEAKPARLQSPEDDGQTPAGGGPGRGGWGRGEACAVQQKGQGLEGTEGEQRPPPCCLAQGLLPNRWPSAPHQKTSQGGVCSFLMTSSGQWIPGRGKGHVGSTAAPGPPPVM